MSDNIIFYIVLCLVLPMALLCFYLEKRARRIVISMICGMLSCFVAFFIEGQIFDLLPGSLSLKTGVIGPVIEETFKLLSVLAVALIVKKGRRGSSANAFSVGVGFCITENFCYLVSYIGTANVFWIIARSAGTGLMHCMSATIIGTGIYFAQKKENHKPVYAAGAFLAALLLHCAYNLLVQSDRLKVIAVMLPMGVFILFFVFLKGTELHNYLCDKE